MIHPTDGIRRKRIEKKKTSKLTLPNINGARESREEHEEKEKLEELAEITREGAPQLEPVEKKVYQEAMRALNKSGVTYAVGATFARNIYTGIWRYTKDLDVFITPAGLKKAMEALEAAGFESEIREKHWLAKAWKDDYFIDLIFGTGHGQLPVEESSFEGSQPAQVLGVETRLIPIEEMIASTAYVAGRRRFDGPEIVHLIRSVKGKLDWDRILLRLGENREILLWHLLLFDFIYPGHSSYLPKDLMAELFEEIQTRWKTKRPKAKSFRGTLLDPFSFEVDIEDWGYEDRRNPEPLVTHEGDSL